MKVIKFLPFIIVLAVMLCSCQSNSTDSGTTQNSSTEETTTASEEMTSVSETTESSESSVNSIDDTAIDELTALLATFKDVQPGSAGCSLKAAKVGFDIMKWAQDTTLTDDQIKSTVADFRDEITDDKDDFNECYSEAVDSAESINNDYEGSKELLDDAGLLEDYNSFTPDHEKISKIIDALKLVE